MQEPISVMVDNPGENMSEVIVRMVPVGGTYGKDMALINDGFETKVEFYDPRYPHDELENGYSGQFISRYSITQMMETPQGDGINLDGGVPDWNLSAYAVDETIGLIVDFESYDRDDLSLS